jgi:hypothetical protein
VTQAIATLLCALVVLELKHYFFDYVVQTPYQFRNKGTYGHPGGVLHAGLHAIGSALAFLVIAPGWLLGIAIVVGEFVLHYHTDWLKEQLGKRYNLTVADANYWRVYGADQLVHHLTYVGIVALLAPGISIA